MGGVFANNGDLQVLTNVWYFDLEETSPGDS